MLRDDSKNKSYINLTIELWKKIYDKLFGGFEDLTLTCAEDDDEEDELANVPKHKLTKNGGYLKDGFVVDSSDTEDEELDTDEDELSGEPTDTSGDADIDDELLLAEIGSELSEESYIE
jgi:hypothetical protein